MGCWGARGARPYRGMSRWTTPFEARVRWSRGPMVPWSYSLTVQSYASPSRGSTAPADAAIPILALSASNSRSAARMRRMSSGNCCMAMNCRFICLSGCAGMPSTVP